MAITKKWVEVDDECFGPDRKNRHWEMYLFICLCALIQRRNGQDFVRRRKTIKPITGKTKKSVLAQLEKFMGQKDTYLKE